jgi:adenylate cyclase
MQRDNGNLRPDSIRDQLRRVLGSADFDASERNRNFLTYAVEAALEGRADRIKAYTIATHVFGRDASFDPQLDTIVRIEAGRLRRSLERYYLKAGANDPVRITIPRGAYVPFFEAAELSRATIDPPAAATARTGPDRHGRAIQVTSFEEDGDHSAFPNFTRGLPRQIIIGLTRFTDLFVFGAPTGSPDAAGAAADPGIDFLLTGSTTLSDGRFRLEVLLREARTTRFLWGDSFERSLKPAEILAVRDEVANHVVRTLAQPYGLLFIAKARDMDGAPPDSLASYDCVVQFYQYWRRYDSDLFEAVRAGLERTILREPSYAEAFACLSLIYTNAFRFGMTTDRGDPREAAAALARRAIELAPNSSRGCPERAPWAALHKAGSARGWHRCRSAVTRPPPPSGPRRAGRSPPAPRLRAGNVVSCSWPNSGFAPAAALPEALAIFIMPVGDRRERQHHCADRSAGHSVASRRRGGDRRSVSGIARQPAMSRSR